MNFLTGRHIPRRTFIRGLGATISLPMLDAMAPAGQLFGQTPAASEGRRLVAIEMVHGAAGAAKYGLEHNLWAPAQVGRDFDLAASALSPLDAYRKYMTIVSNTDVRMAEAFEPEATTSAPAPYS